MTFEGTAARLRRQRRHRRDHPGAVPHVDRPRGAGDSTRWRTSTRSSSAGCSPATSWSAGRNFGSGSSREHAPIAIKGAGVACIVATSFARIFYRNAINVGLPIVTCPGAADGAETGDVFRVDVDAGVVENVTKGLTFDASPLPAVHEGDPRRRRPDALGGAPHEGRRARRRRSRVPANEPPQADWRLD